MNNSHSSHFNLQAAAKELMLENGFEPDFPPEVEQQLAQIKSRPPQQIASNVRDLRNLLWSSIDNDTSRDLDQIEYAEKLPDGTTKVMVGIADVDSFVAKDTPIDKHAAKETCTVYTGVRNFPMLPEELSNGTTSLLEVDGKLAMVTEFAVNSNGEVTKQQIYPALVTNKAQLAYNGVGAWLEGSGPAPEKVAASAELQAQLKLQDEVAQALKTERHRHGALNIETIEVSPVILNNEIVDLQKLEKNRATELIEDFMIAANGVVARTLQAAGISSIRRVVKTPKRWDRIVELAAQHGGKLPAEPDSKALNDFLQIRKAEDPDHFADVSLTVIKLMGSGEYVVEKPGEPAPGHFGLAVEDYTHSTAPNRRFPDVVTQRLIKSVINKQKSPYSDGELTAVATNCTEREDAARKVERGMSKRIAAVTMISHIGQTYSAIVTGAGPKGTFVRIVNPHVEGMLMHGQGVDVGDRLHVKLMNADPERGFIDFVKV